MAQAAVWDLQSALFSKLALDKALVHASHMSNSSKEKKVCGKDMPSFQ